MKNLLLSLLVLVCLSDTYGQIGIKANNTAPIASAQLEVQSTTKAFYPPRMTTGQRTTMPNPPLAGAVVYDTDLNGLFTFNGSVWVSGSGLTLPFSQTLNQYTGYGGGLFQITNTSPTSEGVAINGIFTGVDGFAIRASATNTNAFNTSAIYATNASTNNIGTGVTGYHNGGGTGIYGYSQSGSGGTFSSTSGYSLTTGTGKVGLGTTPNLNADERVDINGRLRIRNSASSAGVWFNNSTNSLSYANGAFWGMKLDTESGIWINNAWRFWVNNIGEVTSTSMAGTGNRPVLVNANGTLNAAPSSQTLLLQVSNFQPLNTSTTLIRYENSIAFTGTGAVVAPINLPVGAKINTIVTRVRDNLNTGFILYSLEKRNISTNTTTQLSTGGSTIASANASPLNYSSTNNLPVTIETNSYYYININAFDSIGNLLSWGSGATFQLDWIEIQYTY